MIRCGNIRIFTHGIRMKRVKNNETFWVTNVSNLIVSLSDLGLSIKPMCSVNLLDSRHYSLSKEQVSNSAASGSIYAKRNKIVVRKVAPVVEKPKRVLIDESAKFPTRQRSNVELNQVKYEELEVSDDEFASDNAELAEIDRLGKWNKP
jgi:hypothetical protein